MGLRTSVMLVERKVEAKSTRGLGGGKKDNDAQPSSPLLCSLPRRISHKAMCARDFESHNMYPTFQSWPGRPCEVMMIVLTFCASLTPRTITSSQPRETLLVLATEVHPSGNSQRTSMARKGLVGVVDLETLAASPNLRYEYLTNKSCQTIASNITFTRANPDVTIVVKMPCGSFCRRM